MLILVGLVGLGVFFYCSVIYPYAAKIERRQTRHRGDRWRRWMGREDDVDDIPWGGPPVSESKPMPPPIDPDAVAGRPRQKDAGRPFQPPGS